MSPPRALISLADGKQQSGETKSSDVKSMTERRPPAKRPAGRGTPRWAKNRDPTSVAALAKSHCFSSFIFRRPTPPHAPPHTHTAHPPSNHWNEFKSILEGGRQTERFRLLYLICLQSHSAGDIYEEVHSYFMSLRHEKEQRWKPNVPSMAPLTPLSPLKSWVMCFFIWSCVASHISLVCQPTRQLPVPWRNALLSKTSACELRSVGWKWEENISYRGSEETQQTKT